MRPPPRPRHLAGLAAALWCLTSAAPALGDSATTELRIAVGLLRSQAAELELLQAQAVRRRLPERAVQGHAIQLDRAVQRAREQVEKAAAPASAQDIRSDARAAGLELAALVRQLCESGAPAHGAEAQAAAPALRERLQRDEAALPH